MNMNSNDCHSSVPLWKNLLRRCFCCCCGKSEEEEKERKILIYGLSAGECPWLQVEQEADYCPYVGELRDLKQGNIITIKGTALYFCERFSINLFCHSQEGVLKDLALHFNPRLSQRYIVRTARINGKWGPEETTSIAPFPFKRDENFVIGIFISDTSFFVQINSIHFCQFDYRIPISRISGLEVKGTGVNIHEVKMGEARSYPTKSPGITGPPEVPISEDSEISWPNPAVGVLQNGLRCGQQVVIIGRVKLLPHSFYVNLQSSVQLWPHPDIPLHLNPRFMLGKKHTVIWNAWQQGSWGEEERAETPHMSPGTMFKLQICCEEDKYSVWLSDNLIGMFMFRMKPDIVKAIYVQGDIDICKIYQSDTPPNKMIAMTDEEYY